MMLYLKVLKDAAKLNLSQVCVAPFVEGTKLTVLMTLKSAWKKVCRTFWTQYQ